MGHGAAALGGHMSGFEPARVKEPDPPRGRHVLVTSWNRCPAPFLEALRQEPQLQQLFTELASAGYSWTMETTGAKIIVAASSYEQVVGFLEATYFKLGRRMKSLRHLRTQHIVLDPDFLELVSQLCKDLHCSHKVKLFQRTSVYVPPNFTPALPKPVLPTDLMDMLNSEAEEPARI